MDITFCTDRPLNAKTLREIEKSVGFEVVLDWQDGSACEYFFGYCADSVEEGEEDPLPYDEAVRCCGVLWRLGIYNFAIEGNGPWAMGMIQRTDFNGLAVSEEDKQHWARTSAIFWGEAEPIRIRDITPQPIAFLAVAEREEG